MIYDKPNTWEQCFSFSDISERNNDYSDTLDFRRWWVKVVTFFVLEVPLRSLITNPQCCIRTHDTGRSFEQFSWNSYIYLVRVHSRVSPVVLENNRPNRTTVMGENVPQKPVFLVQVRWYGVFWEKNLKTVFSSQFPPKKGYIHFCRPTPHSLKNGHAP